MGAADELDSYTLAAFASAISNTSLQWISAACQDAVLIDTSFLPILGLKLNVDESSAPS